MVDPISSSAASAASGLNGSRAAIAENFDAFLSILTTQLRHQNPLEPMNSNEFTSQLVQFSSVEQQLKTNEYLEALISASQSASATQATSYIGKTVTAEGATATLANGQASWGYEIGKDAANAIITVRNAQGAEVFSRETPLAAGAHTINWDGRTADGSQLPDGTYSITIDARDAAGKYIPVSTKTAGVVDGVDFSGAEPVLMVGGATVRLSSVLSVHQ